MHLGALVLVLAFLLGPLPAQAQQPSAKTARIGYLSFSAEPSHLDEAFRQGLRELGYVEGQNIAIEYRWADLKPDRASTLAVELARLKVDVIVTTGGRIPAIAARKATEMIPIVFAVGGPVRFGLVARLDRPGGNLTGLDNFFDELNVKRLELLTEAVPGISRVAVLANPASPATGWRLEDLDAAARTLGVKLDVRQARETEEFDHAITSLARERPGALLVMNDPMFLDHRQRIVDVAAKHRLPGMFAFREFVEIGGLVSYAVNLADIYRRLATYVDKILQGAKPGDLPIEQPTKFELMINVKTAKALGLTMPPPLLLRADRVIE